MEINGSTAPLTATNGRRIKFTPERLQQIKNLVERGLSREQIAETIGVTSRLAAGYLLAARD
jgi:DNA-binding NarL/FixJ family response regulator